MNENKNVACPATDKDVVAVNLKELLSVYADMKRMFYMLKYLIALVQKEEKLKQHHRPYLELRREMLNMCENYLRDLAEIAARTATPLSGCPIKCVDGCGNKDRKETKKDNEVFYTMLDDLIVLVEHTDNLRSFIKLLMNGVDLVAMPIEYGEQVASETAEMVDRWEGYLRDTVKEENP